MTAVDAVAEAVAEARRVAPGWADTSLRSRAALLGALARTVAGASDRVVETVRAETGKHEADVVLAEVVHATTHVGWLSRNVPRVLSPQRAPAWPLLHKRAELRYRPRGVAAVLSPWNYPFLLALLPTATALAAGCPVVLKPSERTPASGRLVARLVADAGFPAGVVQVVDGAADVGERLVTADVDVVAVTGSTATGQRVSELAARRLTPVIAELGGNDPMLVLAGADLRRAARAAVWGACFTAGQSCVAVERVYVVDEVYDDFLAELDRALDDVRVGGDPRRDIGPMASPAQLEVVERQVAEALDRGARLRRGGRRVPRDGREGPATQDGRNGSDGYEPTLLTDLDPGSALLREETFGPVLPVVRVADEAAALRLANDAAHGLHASVWTRDRAATRRVAGQLRAGAVAVNDCLSNYGMPGVPFGGVGASGSGRQGGAEGLRAYCSTLSVTEPRLALPREPQWFPRLGGVRTWTGLARLLALTAARAPAAPAAPPPTSGSRSR